MPRKNIPSLTSSYLTRDLLHKSHFEHNLILLHISSPLTACVLPLLLWCRDSFVVAGGTSFCWLLHPGLLYTKDKLRIWIQFDPNSELLQFLIWPPEAGVRGEYLLTLQDGIIKFYTINTHKYNVLLY